MKKGIKYLILSFCVPLALACTSGKQSVAEGVTLKDALKDKFYIGVALNRAQYLEEDKKSVEIVKKHFNSIVAENCMKSENLQPGEGEFFFDDADRFIEFGEKNNMHIIGHTLIWHSQAPEWFFTDENGNDVTPEVLTERMRSHIHTVVTRYKGRVKGWDVVNEAIEDDGSYRKSKFYRILGEDFIKLAFQFANEADPDAELHYNDFSMAIPEKRDGVVRMIKSLQQQGIKVDAIGMQGHLMMDGPTVQEFEKSILAYSDLGVKVMITELELSALPSPWKNVGANISDAVAYQEKMNPYPDGLPDDVKEKWEKHFLNFFKLFIKHQDKIDRVTLWGVSDVDSWKNDFPINGRTDYPLLFDREYNEKPIVKKIIDLAM